MRAWLVSLGVCLLLGAGTTAHALDGSRGVTQYAQTHFDARDGMPHGLATAIVQTADGYLWTGSEEGLSRFDGAVFTTFDRRNTFAITSNVFTALAVDAGGTLWAGTRDHGLLHVVSGEFRTVDWEPGPQDQQIRALAFDRDGDLWVGMRDRGLVRLRAGALIGSLTTHDGLPSDDVRSILAARDGSLWIGTFRGLVHWTGGRIAPGPVALQGAAVHGIAQDVRGDVWCASDKGLAHLTEAGAELRAELIERPGLSAAGVRQLLFDRNDNLWIGTMSGVVRMTRGAGGALGAVDRLPNPDVVVRALFEDGDGNLWIGSNRGLDRLRDGDVIPFGAREGFTDEPVLGVREDASGAMWITSSGGVLRVAPGQTSATRVTDERGAMYAIYPDARGDVWFGGRDGDVGRWRDGAFTWLGKERWERVRSIAQTGDGLWFGTDHGLFRLRGDRVSDAEAILPGVAVRAIVPDAAGSLWLATDGGGLLRWRASGPATIPPGGPPRTTPATAILFDPDGTMWVGTEGAGLWRLRGGRWLAFTAKDGLFDDLMWQILDDRLGNLWMSSNRGIWRVSRAELEAFGDGRRTTVESALYREADGMRDRECNGAVDPAGWRTRDGRLWFPTGKGLVAIDPAHLHARPPPSALIDSVRVDGAPHRLGDRLTIAPGSTRLELGYTAPALRGADRVRFRYRLDGFDHAWIDAGTQRAAQYTNLPAGEYRFVVEAGLDGAWGNAGALALVLEPQFFQNGWFYALAILAIALTIIAVPIVRVRTLQRRARELDQRVQQAVGEIKVLSGMLPICAWCKKIRDDQGYWSKLEAYLSAHTDAQFTHGICPDCTHKMLADESALRSVNQPPRGGR